MKTLLLSLVLLTGACTNCEENHPILEVSKVVGKQNQSYQLQNQLGQVSNWYLDDMYLSVGDTVFVVDCEVKHIIEGK